MNETPEEKAYGKRAFGALGCILLLGILCILAAWQAEARLGIPAFLGLPAAMVLWWFGAKEMVAGI